ncbi:hypothetical protein EDB19DRAFT_1781346 [Suillus lakei]|nr:hypothetical protein EDB19DRAFT_1781346 [Suillus lakei]
MGVQNLVFHSCTSSVRSCGLCSLRFTPVKRCCSLLTLLSLSFAMLSIAVARLDGRIVRDLVSADDKGFLTGLGLWFALVVPSIYTNSMIRHLQPTLSLRFKPA